MNKLELAIILGSTRPGRNGKAVADWVLAQAQKRDGAFYELIDLQDHPLPMYDEPLSPSLGKYQHEHTLNWSATVKRFDGFVFLTPEYNHSTSAVLKNALDYLYEEWKDKAAAFVSWGGLGGARAVEHLRLIASELHIAHVRAQLSFSLATDFDGHAGFSPAVHHYQQASSMFDELEVWAGALKSIR